MSGRGARTWQLPHSQTTHQFCPVFAKPLRTACPHRRGWRRRLAPPARRFQWFSPPHPGSSCCGPRSLLARLLAAGVWPLLTRCRCCRRSLLPLCLRVLPCKVSQSFTEFSCLAFSVAGPARIGHLDEHQSDRLQFFLEICTRSRPFRGGKTDDFAT